jgi:hypothetical protein
LILDGTSRTTCLPGRSLSAPGLNFLKSPV